MVMVMVMAMVMVMVMVIAVAKCTYDVMTTPCPTLPYPTLPYVMMVERVALQAIVVTQCAEERAHTYM